MSFLVQDIRSKFLKYFENHNHSIIHSSPLIPHNDPTMMFVNSGMVQFKNVFTGVEKRNYSKATSCQKSVRAGGKHNDLENVGYTARHHTFFEMLGNFSFGDYFKEEAISYAWELMTKEFCLPKDKLYVTIYHTDDEAASYWKKIAALPEERIIRIKTNDNFWSMGDLGPCGPCSEIFYDHGDHIEGGLPGTANEDGDRFIEIWNMVFMQYEQIDKDTRIELPKKSIDTGMGLERIAAVLQGVHDNYDIDLFKEIIETSEELTSTKSQGDLSFSHRVIADHLRSSSFLIADGVMPSNEGRGYVLRRIMRRAMRHAHHLGAKEPLLHRMLPKLVSLMGDAYPELKRAESFVKDILKTEEERFKATLDRGLKLLDEESNLIKSGGMLAGDVAFKLYDTFGFPLDLTQDILKKNNISVDTGQFDICMAEQRERARKNWSGSGESKTDKIWFDIKEKYGPTEFLGYVHKKAEGVLAVIIKDGNIVENANEGDNCVLITNQTPFYGESGGQMGDIGVFHANSFTAEILDTKKYLGVIICHYAKITSGTAAIGDVVSAKIDTKYRDAIRRNHSATHILHGVLRKVLGSHVAQKGSQVSSDRLRFDISHPKAITHQEIEQIEQMVNEIILANTDVHTKLMPIEEAMNSGAMALFGEKYDDEVRVVSMGYCYDKDNFSVELCGGTHVARTGDIGLFKIMSEYAISAGIRRIEAITGEAILYKMQQDEEALNFVADTIKAARSEVPAKILDIINSKKLLEKEIGDLKTSLLSISKDEVEKSAREYKNYRLLVRIIADADPKAQRTIAENISGYFDNIIFVYISDNNGKFSILTSCGSEASKTIAASNIVKEFATEMGGTGGGGSSKLAQSGGINMISLEKAYATLENML